MTALQQFSGMLHKRSKSRPLSPVAGMHLPDLRLFTLPPLTVVPSLVASTIAPHSPAHEEARALQAARFTRAAMPRPGPSYVETVDFDPGVMLAFEVRRQDTGLLVGTACLELASAKSFATAVRFVPGSEADVVATQGTFAEIRGFAAQFDLDAWQTLDLIDVLASIVAEAAQRLGIAWLWAQPRSPAMSLFLAELPGVLPPYHFTRCLDVLGWREDSPAYAELRALRLKELPLSSDTLPLIYQITPVGLAHDLSERLALLEVRRQRADLPSLLQAAKRSAHRAARADYAGKEQEPMISREGTAAPETPDPKNTLQRGEAPPPPPLRQSFLYPGASAEEEAIYLRQFTARDAAQRYKTLSYDLLQLAPGMQILDVGCGLGEDLLVLAERVGETGLVVGVDKDLQRIQAAQQASEGRTNIRVGVAAAEHLPFASRSFDALRADRVFQYLADPATVLRELWRVLRPGGVLTLIEPDWQAIALYPGSPAGGDDDHTLHAVLQQASVHPLIGRQLQRFLHQPDTTWEQIETRGELFSFTSWEEVNSLLALDKIAQASAGGESAPAEEVQTWLQAIETAAQHGEFFASMPLFFARARKPADR